VIDAAVALLVERGYGSITVDLLAQHAGVPKSTIYRRWPSKDDILAVAIERFVDQSVEIPDTGSVRDDLVILVSRVIATYAHGAGLTVVRSALDSLQGAAEQPRAFKAVADRRREHYRELLQRGVERGEIDPAADLEMAIDLIFGAMWGRIISAQPVDEGHAARIVDAALAGLTPRD
jgi:AcrR family transcriptional regulator